MESVLFQHTAAPRSLWYHGTSIKNLRSILSEGLVTSKPKEWGVDKEPTSHSPSRESYGGIYVTKNLMVALGAPQDRSVEGRQLVIVLELQPNTLAMDEDEIKFTLNSPLGHRSSHPYSVGCAWLAATHDNVDPIWEEQLREYRDQFVEKAIGSIEQELKDRGLELHEGLRKRLQEILVPTWFASLKRQVAAQFQGDGGISELKRCFERVEPYDKRTDWDKLPTEKLRPSTTDGEAAYRSAVDQVTRTLKALANPSGESFSPLSSARVLQNIGYRGSNHIVAIVEVRRGDKLRNAKGESVAVVHFGALPTSFEADYRRTIGPIEIQAKTNKAASASPVTEYIDEAEALPVSGETVDGLHVDMSTGVPNTSSIAASCWDYEILKGIRVVPMASFVTDTRYSPEEKRRVQKLADAIKQSGSLKPLIVVYEEAGPYILEGGHRFDALVLNGAKEFPALVVVNEYWVESDKTASQITPTIKWSKRPHGFKLRAIVDDLEVGYLLLDEVSQDPGTLYVEDVRVDSLFQRQGIGTTLYEKAIGLAASKGYLKLMQGSPRTSDAEAVWRTLSRTHTVEHGEYGDFILLEKNPNKTAKEKELDGGFNEDGYWAGSGNAASGILPIARDTKRICLAWRSAEVHTGDCFGTVGGAVKDDLSPAESAIAEMKEEVGYTGGVGLHKGWVFRDKSFSYHNFIGVVDNEFEFKPAASHAWETDFIEWSTFADIEELMDAEPGKFHPEFINFWKNSRSLIGELAGEVQKTAGRTPKRKPLDFGYSQFNDRSKEFAKIKWTTSPFRGPGFEISASFTHPETGKTKVIGRIQCDYYDQKSEPGGDAEGVVYASMIDVFDPSWKGTGLGQTLYDKAIAHAKSMGARWFCSDMSLTRASVSSWERLKRRYPVEEIPDEAYISDAEVHTPTPSYQIDLTKVTTKTAAHNDEHVITLQPGTNLYRGIGEEVIHPPSAAHDGCLWVADSKTMARTYIPVAGTQVLTNLDILCAAPRERSSTGDLQQQLGFEYTDVKYDSTGRPQSYRMPEKYERILNASPEPKKEDFQSQNEYYDARHKRFDAATKQFRVWVTSQLKKFGYEPDESGNLRLKVYPEGGFDTLLPNKNQEGTLLTFQPTSPLRIFDMTEGGRREGDLMEPDYRKLDAFESLMKAGYDGVKINDFAQVNNHGNVGHTAIGIFQPAISKLKEVNRETTTHPEDLWGDIQKHGADAKSSLKDAVKMVCAVAEEAGVDLDVHVAKEGILLSKIVVPEGKRGTGIGTQLLNELTAIADQHQVVIALTPDTAFGSKSLSRLKEFYRRFGFKPNTGRTKDFRFRESMIRNPQAGKNAMDKRTPLQPETEYVEGSNGWALFDDQRQDQYLPAPVDAMVV